MAEVRIAEIYFHFSFGLLGLARDRLKDLAAAEFRAELELCRVDPEILRQ